MSEIIVLDKNIYIRPHLLFFFFFVKESCEQNERQITSLQNSQSKNRKRNKNSSNSFRLNCLEWSREKRWTIGCHLQQIFAIDFSAKQPKSILFRSLRYNNAHALHSYRRIETSSLLCFCLFYCIAFHFKFIAHLFDNFQLLKHFNRFVYRGLFVLFFLLLLWQRIGENVVNVRKISNLGSDTLEIRI